MERLGVKTMKSTPKYVVNKRFIVSTLCASIFTLLLLSSAVFADNAYKPYLHKANVPDYPKVKLYGSYSTDLFPGAATYSYSIEVPSGTNGLGPSISITYNSQTIEQRPGILGAGWGMSQNYIYRDVNGTLADTPDDGFKLILGGTTYDLVFAPSDGFFHTKIESFIRIQNLTGASNSYGSHWLVTLKDGTKYRFGFNQDSELTSNTGRNYVLKWNLDQVEDTHGNKIFYSYLEDPNAEDKGTAYLSKIEYNNDKKRKIQFNYEASVRPDVRTVYELGNILTESRRLMGIDVTANDKLVRRYTFEYSDLDPEKSLSSLSKIKYFGSDGMSMLNQVSFEYYRSSPGFTQQASQWPSPTSFSYGDNDYGVRLVDLNRDGFVDIVQARQKTNENKVWINNKNGGWIDASTAWLLPTWITTFDATVSRRYFEERLFATIQAYSVGGMLSQTCPAMFGNEAVEGCEIIKQDTNNYHVIADLKPNEVWMQCYWGDLSENLYSMCCNGTTMYGNTGHAFACCEPGKIWYDSTGYPQCNGNANHLYPNTVGGTFNINFYFSIKPYKTVESDNGVRFVDFNNDGFVDILQGIGTTNKAWMNNGNGWTDVSSQWAAPMTFVSDYKDQGVQFVDFNGDGKVDIIQVMENNGVVTKLSYRNTGSGWIRTDSTWESPVVFVKNGNDTGARIEEINGDGLPDILFDNDTKRQVWLNTGAGWIDASATWSPPSTTTFITGTSSDNGVRFTDINNDGLSDMLEDYANGSTVDRGAWINNGRGWVYNASWQSPEPFTKDGKNIGRRLADVNGDGFADILVSQTNSTGTFVWTWLRNQNTPFMLKKITNELGGTTSIGYRASTVSDNNGNDSLSDLGFNVWVVGSATNDNSMTNTFNINSITSYGYSGGYYDYQDFEFRGFGKVKETLPDNNFVNHYFYQDDDKKGIEYKTEVYGSNGNIFSKVESLFDITSANGCSKVLLNSQTSYLYDGIVDNPKTTRVSYSYDSFGNVVEKFLQGDISVTGDEKDEKYSYATDTSKWIVNSINEYQLFAGDKTTKVKDVMYSYDNNQFNGGISKGDVTQVETWLNPSTGERHVLKYDYDIYGNVIRATDPLGRISNYGFGSRDPTFTYPDYSKNAMNQRTDYSYDLGTGSVLWLSVSGINSSSEYDVFGRVIKEIQPLDSSSSPTKTYAYFFDGVAPETIKVSSLVSSGKTYDTYYFYDGLSNFIQAKKPADNNQQDVINVFYDKMGRVTRTQYPYFASFSTELSIPSAGIGSVSYMFDPLGRVVSVLKPDGTSKTVNFIRDTITAYDENGHRKAYFLDAYDRITKVTEYNDNPLAGQNYESETYTTTYAYDTSDNLIKIVDNAGNIYSLTYDSLGRRIALGDPDLGNWNYIYDLAGNLISENQRGTKNIVTGDGFYREYDSLNQMIRIRKGSTSISPIIENYTYDPFGQRIKIEKNDSANTKIYTPFKEFMRIVNKSGTYDFTYIYQNDILVSRINPDGSKYFYYPDNLGSTSLITDNAGNSVENNFYGPFGEIISGGKTDYKLYTGQFKDSVCQYYYGARYYNPCLGSFTQPDQVTSVYNPQSLNHFSYVLNNPYVYIDKNGKNPILAAALIIASEFLMYGFDFFASYPEFAYPTVVASAAKYDYNDPLAVPKGFAETFAYAGAGGLTNQYIIEPTISKFLTSSGTIYKSPSLNTLDDYYTGLGVPEPKYTIGSALHEAERHANPYTWPTPSNTPGGTLFAPGEGGPSFAKEVFEKATKAVVQNDGRTQLIADLGRTVGVNGETYGKIVVGQSGTLITQYPIFGTPPQPIYQTSLIGNIAKSLTGIWNGIKSFFGA
jgi:RHS repeat-associated protein